MSRVRAALRIAMPAFEQAARLPAAEWLVARGDRTPESPSAWRQWLLDDAGLGRDLLERFPAGPCVRAYWAGEPARGTWACAAPVHLLTAIDHLQLAAPAPLPLDEQESGAFLASLDAHLAGTGFRLHGFPGRGWLVECPPELECMAVEPAAGVGRNLRELLPAGRDAAQVRGVINELQMLLHEHPVNERRAARGAPAVNSLWLWGFGAAHEPRASALGVLLTDDDWLAGLWRLHGGEIASPDRLDEFLRRRSTALRVGLGPTSSAGESWERWTAFDRAILAPVRAALIDGALQQVSLRIGRAVFEVPQRARRRFWRRSRPLVEALR